MTEKSILRNALELFLSPVGDSGVSVQDGKFTGGDVNEWCLLHRSGMKPVTHSR